MTSGYLYEEGIQSLLELPGQQAWRWTEPFEAVFTCLPVLSQVPDSWLLISLEVSNLI